jgi:tetratricopeptide (TPR) repeat protein
MPASGNPGYDAFISYSHSRDRSIAAALQSVVQKLGKPWYRRRALRLFRDDTSLSATPQLWPSIEQALSRSRFLVLLASPEAAASPWVNKEVAYWLDHNSADRVLIALTDGSLDWNGAAGDFRWHEATPVPPALAGHFSTEPRWIDLRSYRASASPGDARFTELAADFAAAIHGVPKEDLLSQEVRQQRQALRLAVSAAAALAILLGIAAWLGTVAETQKREMQAQRDRAEQALVSATDTTLELAKAYRNAETAPGAMTDIIVKIRKLQKQLSVDASSSPGMRLTQGTVLDETAETLLVWGDTFEALDAATEARSLFQGLAAEAPDNLDYQHALEMGDKQLGEVLGASGHFAEALDAYRQALSIGKTLVAKDAGNGQWQRDLFLTYAGIALVAVDQNDLQAALDAYEHAKTVALRLNDVNSDAATTVSDLAWVNRALDEIHREMAEATPKKK